MSAPDWVLPEGCHEVARARIERDWRDSRRALRDVRRVKALADAEWAALPSEPRTIEQHQAHVLTLKGEDR